MPLAKLSEFWLDSAGALSAGTMTEVPCTISHDTVSQLKKITSPVCRGDGFETAEGEVLQISIPVQLKFEKSNALLQRLRAAHEAGTQAGVLVATGDKTESGQNTLTFNALVETYTEKSQTGSHVIVEVNLVPHGASTVDPVYAVVA